MAGIVVSRAIATSPGGWIADARRAEDAGRAAASAADLAGCDAFVDAALALQATRDLPIVIAVALPTRSPLQSALAAATLGRLAPGRLTVGFAAGSRDLNEHGHGVVFDSPVTRLREFVRCVRAILRAPAGEPVEVVGTHHRVRGFGVGLDRTALPLVIGAHGPGAARLAGEEAEGILVHLLTPLSVLAQRAQLARSVSALPDFSVGAGRTVSVAADEELALRDARAEVAAFLTLPRFRSRLAEVTDADVLRRFGAAADAGDARAAMAALPAAVVREFVTVTTPERFDADLADLDVDAVTPVPAGTFWRIVPGDRGLPQDAAQRAVASLRAALLRDPG